MKKPIDVDRLKHIIDAIEKIERYLSGCTLDQFRLDGEKTDAVVRNLEIVGEAISHLTRDLKARHPHAEWQIAAAMRNRLIHGYFDVDPEIVWQTSKDDLPNLKTVVLEIISELENENVTRS